LLQRQAPLLRRLRMVASPQVRLLARLQAALRQ